jgi:CheY-like chemotaxis protein
MDAHIIVCSKNSVLLDAASQTFDPGWFRLTVCESGMEVLGMVRVVKADLLILDLQTPGLNGLLIIAAARELAPGLPIVAVSTTPQEDARTISQRGVSYATLPSGPDIGAQALSVTLAAIGLREGLGLPLGVRSR